MTPPNLTREKIILILNEYGYFSYGEIEDGYEAFINKDNIIFLSNCCIENEYYPIGYDFRFNGCENGVRAYIEGIDNFKR